MNHEDYLDGPRLLADIGGTNARFALERGPGRITEVATLACDGHPRFVDAVRAYLRRRPEARVRHAVVAIANPIEGDTIRMTNHHWQFSIEAARTDLGLDTLLLVNDFAALAMSVPALAAAELVQVGGATGTEQAARAGGVIGVLGAGTGLGVAGLLPAGDAGGWTVLASEGGHVAFSPADEREQQILAFCWRRYPHVSAERLISGPGLSLIHEALSTLRGDALDTLTPALVVERGLAGEALCRETLEIFCGMLGTMAANLAVTLNARGGIYIGGGVVPRLGSWFAGSPFRARFEHKGRFSSFTAQIPCFVIHAPTPALSGAATMLSQHLGHRIQLEPEIAPQLAPQIGSVASLERRTAALTP